MIIQPIRKAFRRAVEERLEARGYYVRHRKSLPYGVDYMIDIERFCRAWRLSVRTFFDVGANEGQTSAAALARFPNAKVFAFEPHPQTFQRLQALIGNHPRVTAYELALAETCGTVPFFEHESSSSDAHQFNSLAPNRTETLKAAGFNLDGRAIRVPCSNIDVFCQERAVDSIDVLKIDVEGCDLLVMRGAKDMLASGRVRFVFAEFNDVIPPAPGVPISALGPMAEFLSGFGLRFIASYTEFVRTNQPMVVLCNALFVLPP
jgi:FkbM family methyltransferase